MFQLRRRVALPGRLAEPVECDRLVFGNAVAAAVVAGERPLSPSVALFGPLAKPLEAVSVVRQDARIRPTRIGGVGSDTLIIGQKTNP